VSDAHYGAIPHGYIGWESNSEHVNLDGLKNWVDSRIAAYKVPARWQSIHGFPKAATVNRPGFTGDSIS